MAETYEAGASVSEVARRHDVNAKAMGETGAVVRRWALRRALASISASTKNLHRAWLQHAASRIDPGCRSAS